MLQIYHNTIGWEHVGHKMPNNQLSKKGLGNSKNIFENLGNYVYIYLFI